jgi:hypothetical protein
MVRHLSDDLDDDAAIGGGLSIHRVNEDFAVLEPDGGDLVVNFLYMKAVSEDAMPRVQSINVPVDRSMACRPRPQCHG